MILMHLITFVMSTILELMVAFCWKIYIKILTITVGMKLSTHSHSKEGKTCLRDLFCFLKNLLTDLLKASSRSEEHT